MAPDTAKALAEAKALVAALEADDGSAATHLDLLRRTGRVQAALEDPYDAARRWFEGMATGAALFILIRLGALQQLPAPGDGGGVPAAAMAAACSVDVSVITRAMRVLLSAGIGAETGPAAYAHNARSQAFQPEALGGFVCVCVDFVRAWAAMPAYARAHAPEDLHDPRRSLYAFAAGHEGKTYYEVLDLDPPLRHLWNIALQRMEINFPVTGLFPFEGLEAQVREAPQRPFIVDIGGGRGQALLAVQRALAGSFGGRLVLQDLPLVIDSLKPEEIPGIETMKHDIFTPQPIKHAHVYFMRRLLHDFYDPAVREILRNTVSAMGPDSRLVISDMLVPERVDPDGNKVLYWVDFSVLTMSGKERTLAEFRGLLDEAGLELVEVYRAADSDLAMLETRLKTAL